MIQFTDMHVAYLLPSFFSEEDARPARDQLHENYAHGGGVNPFKGFTLHNWGEVGKAYLSYPEDPPMREVSRGELRDETIILFNHSWVAIVQPNGTYIVTRCD